ncbi:competence type IV pilus minor pilin ComGF [Halobacillus sp. Marseille-P3879]|uniref:competence type IV pilus minor pilin ComGF n=1 Tax=Halobacillus sp. Marseille-P3879 TaxID=2045014 RepID=UPI000C7DE588|nr:competence type IV pilus minor pilin ComGF [Halobacillus sp. Marseille-P3879]
MRHHKELGFTFLETIISLTVVTILLTLSIPTIEMMKSSGYYEELAAFQFFTFIEDEMNVSTKLLISKEKIVITDLNNRNIEIEKYRDNIRRRVDAQGHELLIHDIKAVSFTEAEGNLKIQLTTKNRGDYYKTIPLPVHM